MSGQMAEARPLPDIRARLLAVYQACNPGNIEKLDYLLQKYAGQEDFLLDSVCAKYAIDPDNWEGFSKLVVEEDAKAGDTAAGSMTKAVAVTENAKEEHLKTDLEPELKEEAKELETKDEDEAEDDEDEDDYDPFSAMPTPAVELASHGGVPRDEASIQTHQPQASRKLEAASQDDEGETKLKKETPVTEKIFLSKWEAVTVAEAETPATLCEIDKFLLGFVSGFFEKEMPFVSIAECMASTTFDENNLTLGGTSTGPSPNAEADKPASALPVASPDGKADVTMKEANDTPAVDHEGDNGSDSDSGNSSSSSNSSSSRKESRKPSGRSSKSSQSSSSSSSDSAAPAARATRSALGPKGQQPLATIYEHFPANLPREKVQAAIFRHLDTAKKGRLGYDEMLRFSQLNGLDGEEEYPQEYRELCKDWKMAPSKGFDLATWKDVLDDESPKGLYLEDHELRQTLDRLIGQWGESLAQQNKDSGPPETADESEKNPRAEKEARRSPDTRSEEDLPRVKRSGR
mmetsp:Transcript_13749/g.30283  ORF Transcript_13749/g.30283 Transcript_13749/m.30283 type:complete len:518 (+) Transcript_13749:60-1613(+)